MSVFERAGDHVGVAKAVLLGSEPDRLQNHYTPFRQAYERALKHVRTAHDRHWELWVLDYIADAVTLGPDPIPDAITRMERILQDGGGNPTIRVHIYTRTGYLLALQGREAEALNAQAQAEAIFRELGGASYLAPGWFAHYSGDLLRRLGRLEHAERLLREAEEAYAQSGESDIRSTILALLAEVLLDQGRADDARQTALDAIKAGATDDYLTLIHAHGVLATILSADDAAAGETAARRAVELAEDSDMLLAQGEQWKNLGYVLLGQGRREEANEAFTTALDRFERKGATALAHRVLDELTATSGLA
jgi:tetratricopeptide (TPR) repeat protein